jgi:hypothetical protein
MDFILLVAAVIKSSQRYAGLYIPPVRAITTASPIRRMGTSWGWLRGSLADLSHLRRCHVPAWKRLGARSAVSTRSVHEKELTMASQDKRFFDMPTLEPVSIFSADTTTCC